MKSTVESLNPTRVKLTIEVPFEEFKPALDQAYKAIGQQISVPGFRKGKVPSAVIDQRVGRAAVLSQALDDSLGGWYSAAVQESAIQPLGQPEVDLTKFEDGEDIEVTAEVDVRPEIALPDLSTIEIEVPVVEVTEADIDEQLEALRERFGTYSVVERAAADGDSLTIDLSAAHKDGSLIDEAQADGLPYVVGKATMLDGLDDAVTGLFVDESATFATTLVGGELAGEEVDVTVTVREVKESELPDVDEDFVQMASAFETVEELRGDLESRLTRGKRMEQIAAARDEVLAKAVAAIDAPLPEALVDDELKARRGQLVEQLAMSGSTIEDFIEADGKTMEEFESDLEQSVRDSIIAQFLLDQVVAERELEVENEELSSHIMQRAQQSGQDPNEYVQHILQHNHVPEMMAEVLRGKAVAVLIESVVVKDTEGTVLDMSELRADGSFAE